MRFQDFIEINEKLWDEYFSQIFREILYKNMVLEDGGVLLFPNVMLFTETDTHYIVELLGATRGYQGLTTKIHKEDSTLKYLYQFEYDIDDNYEGAAFCLNGGNINFKNLLISRPIDTEQLHNRFEFHSHWQGPSLIRQGNETGPLLTFGKNFSSCYLNNCVLVNRFEDIYRVKNIVHMDITKKNNSKSYYEQHMKAKLSERINSTDDLHGMIYCKEPQIEDLMLSNQFLNTFLIPGLRETTIGEFLKLNPQFIQKALACKSFLYEPAFDWIEGNPDPDEKNINPDLLLERADNKFNICDLKLPKLDKKNLTKGKHKRRRFVDAVQEGIAQLVNYEEYFTFDKNREFAKNRYNVEVEEPELILIVGNYENLNVEEVREASRSLKSNCRIIDYDTLNALFLNKV